MNTVESLLSGDIQVAKVGQHAVKYAGKKDSVSHWRFETLLTKEPETIEWIDSFQEGETLWDIGANVGVYSIYAAMRGIRVVAFEPHFANYFQLCANIALNNLGDKISAICLAFTDRKMINTFNMAEFTFGTALSTFGSEVDCHNKAYIPAFRQGMIGYDIDGFIEDFALDVPNHVKIDVDGLEFGIVQGGQKMFSRPEVKSASIELVATDPVQVKGVEEIMMRSGFQFIHMKHNSNFVPCAPDIFNFLYRRAA